MAAQSCPMSNAIKLVTIDGDGCLFAYTNIGSAFHSSWDAVAFAYGFKDAWDERSKSITESPAKSNQWAEEDAADLRGLPRAASRLGALSHSLFARRAGVSASQPGPSGAGVALRLSRSGRQKGGRRKPNWTFCFCNVMHVENGVFSGTFDQAVSPWHKAPVAAGHLPPVQRHAGGNLPRRRSRE
jgi:hypothetical protein